MRYVKNSCTEHSSMENNRKPFLLFRTPRPERKYGPRRPGYKSFAKDPLRVEEFNMADEIEVRMPLKLVVFGGSGLTGKEVVTQALDRGHHVTAIVRSPEKIQERHPNLELVRGDACELESFSAALEGKDAVISCLGVFASILNPTTFYSESMFAILEGMKRNGVKRLAVMTAWCTQPGPNNRWLADWIVNPLFLSGMIKDMTTMEKMIEKTNPQDLNYTIIRPCGLTNGKRTGMYKVEEGQCNTGGIYLRLVSDRDLHWISRRLTMPLQVAQGSLSSRPLITTHSHNKED